MSTFNRPLHWFAAFTALATLCLIGLGGLVTSHGVGLAVPDWPNTYGYNMFFFPISQWVGGIFYEHTHRLVASAVGLLTVILALWLHGQRARPLMRWGGLTLSLLGFVVLASAPHRWTDAVVVGGSGLAFFSASYFFPRCGPSHRWLRRLGITALIAVVAQGVLGGLRVTQLKDELGIFHATLAQLFFVLVCGIALFSSHWWNHLSDPPGSLALRNPGELPRLRRLLVGTTLLILIQLILGATMRHQHAGLAIPDFPLAYGKLWPDTDPAAVERYNQQRLEVTALKPITAFQVRLQMAHRIVALLIVAGVMACAAKCSRVYGKKNFCSFVSLGWLALILAQVLLGALTIWSDKAADLATAHVVVGVLSLAGGAILCIVTIRESVVARKQMCLVVTPGASTA